MRGNISTNLIFATAAAVKTNGIIIERMQRYQ